MYGRYRDELIDSKFDIKEFLDLNNDAAVRTRWISLVLVIATVLIGVGFYNSLKTSWARHRVVAVYDNEYIQNVNSKEESPVLDYFFGEKDFKKPPLPENKLNHINNATDEASQEAEYKIFVCHIEKTSSEHPISTYLFDKFNEKTQVLIKDQCKSEKPVDPANEEVLRTSLFLTLNMILKDKFLYEKYYKAVLDDETLKFIQSIQQQDGSISEIKPKDLIRLNRFILEDTYPDYIRKSRDIIPLDEEKNENILSPEEKRRVQLQSEITRAYIDNVIWITIPVFGISIDVNDLGTIGGFALFIIVLLLRFSLSREIKNLNLSFREAVRHDKLRSFYYLLAMRQVLTVPQMESEIKNKGLAACSKLLCLLPAIILTLGVSYDVYSTYKLFIYEVNTAINTLLFGIFWVILVSYFSFRCIERKIHIDEIWNDYYRIMDSRKTFRSLTTKSFQTSENIDFETIVNRRLHNIPGPNRFWIYKLISQTPGFIRDVFKTLFKRQRFEVLFPFFLEPEPENKKEINESEMIVELKKWRNRLVIITLSLLLTYIFLITFINFSDIIAWISRSASDILKRFQYKYLISFFEFTALVILCVFIFFLLLSSFFVKLIDQKNSFVHLNLKGQSDNEDQLNINKKTASINRQKARRKSGRRK